MAVILSCQSTIFINLFFLENIDVLVDGPFIKELMDDSIEWRGSKNQRIIKVPDSLKENKVIIDKNFK